jgi:hypothetical protein
MRQAGAVGGRDLGGLLRRWTAPDGEYVTNFPQGSVWPWALPGGSVLERGRGFGVFCAGAESSRVGAVHPLCRLVVDMLARGQVAGGRF